MSVASFVEIRSVNKEISHHTK